MTDFGETLGNMELNVIETNRFFLQKKCQYDRVVQRKWHKRKTMRSENVKKGVNHVEVPYHHEESPIPP